MDTRPFFEGARSAIRVNNFDRRPIFNLQSSIFNLPSLQVGVSVETGAVVGEELLAFFE